MLEIIPGVNFLPHWELSYSGVKRGPSANALRHQAYKCQLKKLF
jgi:hypothetical protein